MYSIGTQVEYIHYPTETKHTGEILRYLPPFRSYELVKPDGCSTVVHESNILREVRE